MGVGSLIPILYTPIMLRILGQQEYGLYKLSGSVTGYLSLLSLGIGSAIVRYLIKAQKQGGHTKEESVFSLFIALYRIIAVLVFVCGCFISSNLDIWYSASLDEASLLKLKTLAFIMTCNTSISFVLGPFSSIITAHERFIFLQTVGIFLTVFTPVVNLIALYLNFGSIGLAYTTLFINIISNLIYRYYVLKKLNIRIKYRNLPWRLANDIASFSFWVFLANLTSLLYNSTDTLLIGAKPELGANAVAVYAFGTILTSIVVHFTAAISNVLSPRVNDLFFSGATKEELTELGIRVGRLQLFIVSSILASFISFGHTFIHFYVGDEYQEAFYISLLTAIPISIPLLQNVFLNVAMAEFKHKFRSLVYLSIAIINVIGTFLILPYWGIIGAAFVTGASSLLGHGFIMNWYYGNKLGLGIIVFWKRLMPILIVPIILCILMPIISKSIDYTLASFIISLVCFISILVILQYQISMNEYEKNLLFKSLIKKIIKKNGSTQNNC